jgi:outer membrane protein assembly factor BamB
MQSSLHLRVWPALFFLMLLAGTRLAGVASQEMSPRIFAITFLGPLIAQALVVFWWLLFSRARLADRFLVPLVVAGAGFASLKLSHYSVQSLVFAFYIQPVAVGAFLVAVLVLSRFERRFAAWTATLISAALFATWPFVRNEGFTGDFQSSFHWRWTPTAEDLYLAKMARVKDADVTAPWRTVGAIKWPAFRGPNRDGVVLGVKLAEDWKANPPRQIWRNPIGPGWSSFAAAGDLIFTQEQRGEKEAVVCYDAETGKEVWHHEDSARFFEPVAGAGPRATPTLEPGALYALGATGVLCRLDPATGTAKWSRELQTDLELPKAPMWGFSASPLVTHGLVIVHGGVEGTKKGYLVAYDAETGDLRWKVEVGDHSYSSPQLSTVAGQECVLMVTNAGLTAHEPKTGKMLWSHDWMFEGYRVVQPQVIDRASVLLGTSVGSGTRRLDIADGTAKEAWTTQAMRPGFNDFVVHHGYLYGIDNNFLACIDLKTGEKKWKDGRYGNGEILLLPDANQLLVISERGELVLLRTNPERREEVARHPVLTGKTWNHPVLVGNRVYVRNGEEAACFELPTK